MSEVANEGIVSAPSARPSARDEWARCRHWIEAALARSDGTYEIEDIEAAICAGTMQFWPGRACACVTEIVSYPHKKIFNVYLVGGDLHELVDKMEPVFCDFARASGCDSITGMGREGWRRALEKHGYRHAFTVMTKDLFQ